jgi:hypothetical protein
VTNGRHLKWDHYYWHSEHSPKSFTEFKTLNVMVEWLTLLLHIKEVPGSNLSPQTSFLTEVFIVFLRPSRQRLG